MTTCCGEYGCKRKIPIKVRRSGLTGRWYAVTRYTIPKVVLGRENAGTMIAAIEKHDITDDLVAAMVDAGWTPPKETTTP